MADENVVQNEDSRDRSESSYNADYNPILTLLTRTLVEGGGGWRICSATWL